MNFFRVKITKDDLAKLSEDEQLLLFQLTHFLNELNILQKCVIMSANGINTFNEIEKHGQVSLTLFFIRLLAGKLYEGWKRLDKDFIQSKLYKTYERELSSTGQESLDKRGSCKSIKWAPSPTPPVKGGAYLSTLSPGGRGQG